MTKQRPWLKLSVSDTWPACTRPVMLRWARAAHRLRVIDGVPTGRPSRFRGASYTFALTVDADEAAAAWRAAMRCDGEPAAALAQRYERLAARLDALAPEHRRQALALELLGRTWKVVDR